MTLPKVGDKMFLVSDFEKLVEVTVTKATEKRITISGSHFFKYVNISDSTKKLYRSKVEAKDDMIKPLKSRIQYYQEEIKRIEKL